MCGLIGYLGSERAYPIIRDGLKHLEYRGYDSAGIATLSDKINVSKVVGVDFQGNELAGNIGIGHTRWATHGEVSVENAHPLLDCKKQIAVVHNGTIDNYQELKKELISRGHVFTSETDTEVIPHLLEEMPLNEVLRKLEGTYALLIIKVGENKIVVARKDNPLVIAKVDNGWMVASDENVLGAGGRYFVENGEILEINYDMVLPLVYSTHTSQINDKGNFNHFMLKEIKEQPSVLLKMVELDNNIINQVALDIKRAHQVVFTASGTSRYASLIGRFIISKAIDRLGEVIAASEFQYFVNTIRRGTIVIAVSQSGETMDVIKSIRLAKEQDAYIIAITNNTNSMLGRMADRVIGMDCGVEIGVAASKSFIGQLAIFYLIYGEMIGKLNEVRNDFKVLAEVTQSIISLNEDIIKEIAGVIKDKNDFYYLGRGINFAISGESALKMKEISYIHAEGMAAGELKHGTLALITKGVPVCGICPNDYTYNESILNLIEAKARGGLIIGISDKDNPVFDYWLRIPKVNEMYYPLVSIICPQLLAYWTAVVKGLNPDKPRNLAKSVTVT